MAIRSTRLAVRRRGLLAAAAAAAVTFSLVSPGTGLAASAVPSTPKTDGAGIINLLPGYQYDLLATGGETPVVSTESGQTFAMPEDFDANVTVTDESGQTWLVTAHELTRIREGETFFGDDGKAFVPEQATVDDGDVDGWGSVTRIPLSKNGRKAGPADVITTGLHDLCAGALTPWGTFLVNEEFPFPGDTVQPYRSGWVWEVDPITGAQTKLTGMGRFSHEQEALADDGAWYLTNDFGNDQFIFRFVPDSPTDLVNGDLYGLAFNKATKTGQWIGPLDPNNPTGNMESLGYSRSAYGFSKGEGIVATPDGDELIFTESGSPTSSNPGRIWRFSDLTDAGLTGEVIAEGNFATMSHPDNIRFSPAGDLFIMEDNSSALSKPETGGMNEIRVLPAGMTGTENTTVFATLPNGDEPTGPWFSDDGTLLYLSIQGDPSRLIVIRGPESFNRSR
jgi:secreted PhoX family phosphatase